MSELDRNRKFVLEELVRVSKETIEKTEALLASNKWDREGEFYNELWETVCAVNNYIGKGMSGWSTRSSADTKPYRSGQFFTLGPEDDFDPESLQQKLKALNTLKESRELTKEENDRHWEITRQLQKDHDRALYADDPEMLAWINGES